MVYLLTQFIRGVVISILSFVKIVDIFNKWDYVKIYINTILINLIFVNGATYIINNITNNIHILVKNTNFIGVYYVSLFNTTIILTILKLLCYVLSIDKIETILNKLKNYKVSIYISLNEKIYYFILSTVFYLIINLFKLIPYINIYIVPILNGYAFSYFSFEYACKYNGINEIDKITILESNHMFFIGYGIPYIVLSYFLNIYIPIFNILFPISVLKLTSINISKNTKYCCKIFTFPILLLNIILDMVTFIMNLYYTPIKFTKVKND